jgi:hypothetical protein
MSTEPKSPNTEADPEHDVEHTGLLFHSFPPARSAHPAEPGGARRKSAHHKATAAE